MTPGQRTAYFPSGRRHVIRSLSAVILAVVFALVPMGVAGAQDVQDVELPGVEAAGAVLWDPADDRILWGREARTPRPMASTTKIMTALLAVEAGTIGDVVTVSERAARVGRIPGGATLGLAEGEQLPMRELLAGLLLRSGNDAAVAVAEHVAGTEAAFVDLMNTRARALGLTDTNFLNASGLTDDPAHHASPLDLARLGEVAMGYPVIATLAAAPRWPTDAFGVIDNRNELLTAYPGADGLKTGFTTLAGRCLVATADRGGRELISVVLGSEDHFSDSTAVLDHGYEDFRRIEIGPTSQVGTWRTSGGAVAIGPETALAMTVPTEAEVAIRVEPEPSVASTVDAGEEVGEVELVVDGEVTMTSTAVTAAGITRSPAGVGAAVQDSLRGLARLAAAGRPTSVPSQAAGD